MWEKKKKICISSCVKFQFGQFLRLPCQPGDIWTACKSDFLFSFGKNLKWQKVAIWIVIWYVLTYVFYNGNYCDGKRLPSQIRKNIILLHCKCFDHKDYGDWKLQGTCRENLHYLWKRAVRIAGFPRNSYSLCSAGLFETKCTSKLISTHCNLNKLWLCEEDRHDACCLSPLLAKKWPRFKDSDSFNSEFDSKLGELNTEILDEFDSISFLPKR